MKLHLLEKRINEFIHYHLNNPSTDWYFPHSLVNHFHETWYQLSNTSLKERYESSLRSEISQRWWKRENYRPREIMLKLISADEELATIAFKDLSNDNSSMDGRISRFQFYAEELLEMYRQKHLREIESHHHQDASIISLYLAGLYPEKYTLYPGLDAFQAFLKRVESPDAVVVDDLVRYSKVSNIVFKFLQKNDQFNQLNEFRMSQGISSKFVPFQTVFEIIAFEETSKIPALR